MGVTNSGLMAIEVEYDYDGCPVYARVDAGMGMACFKVKDNEALFDQTTKFTNTEELKSAAQRLEESEIFNDVKLD